LPKKAPKARVVCAFNTVPSEVLFGVFEARSKKSRPNLVYCGDKQRQGRGGQADRITRVLIRLMLAPLRIARYTEPFALLMGEIAYNSEGGPGIAYRFERFAKSRS
jgi:8-hydroxy-5-deazaflavin:NADPH oxidoreductase